MTFPFQKRKKRNVYELRTKHRVIVFPFCGILPYIMINRYMLIDLYYFHRLLTILLNRHGGTSCVECLRRIRKVS